MPEQAEEGNEEAEAAELDALLELFREPEEPPRKKIPGTVWMFLALVFAMVAVWLAARVATGQLVARSDVVAMKPTKSGDREQRGGKAATGSVVEEYIARCKKGMTAKEVRWIVEDFQKAGLDDGPGSFLARMAEIFAQPYSQSRSRDVKAGLKEIQRDLGDRQRSWYAEALSDALRLDKRQKLQVSNQLRLLMEEDLARFLEREGPGIESYFENEGYRANWLVSDAYAPWALCALTPEQEAVTSRSEIEKARRDMAGDSGEDLAWTSIWLDRGTPFRFQPSSAREGGDLDDVDSELLLSAGSVFPLEAVQVPEGNAVFRMDDLTHLHPAQLKILLLLDPERASQILEALDRAEE